MLEVVHIVYFIYIKRISLDKMSYATTLPSHRPWCSSTQALNSSLYKQFKAHIHVYNKENGLIHATRVPEKNKQYDIKIFTVKKGLLWPLFSFPIAMAVILGLRLL